MTHVWVQVFYTVGPQQHYLLGSTTFVLTHVPRAGEAFVLSYEPLCVRTVKQVVWVPSEDAAIVTLDELTERDLGRQELAKLGFESRGVYAEPVFPYEEAVARRPNNPDAHA
jgi:hypothetical protein